MSNIPPTLVSLLEQFFADHKPIVEGKNHGFPEVTKDELASLREIVRIIIRKKWETDRHTNPVVKSVLVDQPRCDPFDYVPVPRINNSHLSDGVDLESEVFYDYVHAVEKNHHRATLDMHELMDFIRRRSGHLIQRKEWDKLRVKGAIEQIERERGEKE